jgi:hypothetical protein
MIELPIFLKSQLSASPNVNIVGCNNWDSSLRDLCVMILVMQKVILYKLCIELSFWYIIRILIIAKLLNFKGAAMNDSWDVSDKSTYTPFILKQNSNRTCGSVIANNVWCIKNCTKHRSETVLRLVRILMHQMLCMTKGGRPLFNLNFVLD